MNNQPGRDMIPTVARAFHEAYERLAPEFGYKTREASAVPWEDVPLDNKRLMESTVRELFFDGIIRLGPQAGGRPDEPGN